MDLHKILKTSYVFMQLGTYILYFRMHGHNVDQYTSGTKGVLQNNKWSAKHW